MRPLTAPIFYAIYPFKLAADGHPCLGLVLVLMRPIWIGFLAEKKKETSRGSGGGDLGFPACKITPTFCGNSWKQGLREMAEELNSWLLGYLRLSKSSEP